MTASNPTLIVIGAVLIVALIAAVGAWAYAQGRKRSQRLQQHYGPEYGRTVERLGNQSKAEADLLAREKRVQRLNIIPLSAADAARFGQAWTSLQGRFVDNPKGVVIEADRLVSEVMAKRNYPVGDFESRAADVSVDHPAVVANYRAARAIAVRDKAAEATTEDLRKAVVHYRALFAELLEVNAVEQRTAFAKKNPQLSVQS
jgi:hypothetical protein